MEKGRTAARPGTGDSGGGRHGPGSGRWGHRQGQWLSGHHLPDPNAHSPQFPFCQLATILTAAPCHHPVTLSIFLFQGAHPSHKRGPLGVSWARRGEGGLARLDYRPPPPPFLDSPSSWVPQLNRA